MVIILYILYCINSYTPQLHSEVLRLISKTSLPFIIELLAYAYGQFHETANQLSKLEDGINDSHGINFDSKISNFKVQNTVC